MTQQNNLPKDGPLRIEHDDDELIIRIGVNTLKHAAEHCTLFDRGETVGPYVEVVDSLLLLSDIRREMLREEEDGSSPLTTLFDQSIMDAFADGSLAFADSDEGLTEEKEPRDERT